MNRNEKSAVQGQIFENLRANSSAIYRELSEIWTDQTILQSVHFKYDILLYNQHAITVAEKTKPLGHGPAVSRQHRFAAGKG
jgi:hypothetical protein